MKNIVNYRIKAGVVLVGIFLISIMFFPAIPAQANASQEKIVTATIQPFGIKKIQPSQIRLTLQQMGEIENILADMNSQLQQTKSEKEAQQIFNSLITKLSQYKLFSTKMTIPQIQNIVFKNKLDTLKVLPSNEFFNSFNNKYCMIVGFVTGSSLDVNVFVLVGIGKLLINGEDSGALWWTYGNLKLFRFGQWYTQFRPNAGGDSHYSNGGYLFSVGLNGIKIGLIRNADPAITMERFTGLKITFKTWVDSSFGSKVINRDRKSVV